MAGEPCDAKDVRRSECSAKVDDARTAFGPIHFRVHQSDVSRRRGPSVARSLLALGGMYATPHTVYVLRSDVQPDRFYTGITSNLERRLAAHNDGISKHTASGRPWHVVVSIDFRGTPRQPLHSRRT